MKKNILALTLFSLVFFSCNDSGGNKNIIPATDESAAQNSEAIQDEKKSELKYTLQWTAFKTPEKVGVKGTFKDITLTDTKEGKTIEESLSGAKFSCNTATVSTGDDNRDNTLNENFFTKLSDAKITGSFGKFENGKIPVTINLNGKEKVKDFTYTVNGNEVDLKGSIDIISDFGASDAFGSLHKACKELHNGKTWTDVNLEIKISK